MVERVKRVKVPGMLARAYLGAYLRIRPAGQLTPAGSAARSTGKPLD
jgi:hypothetical protein